MQVRTKLNKHAFGEDQKHLRTGHVVPFSPVNDHVARDDVFGLENRRARRPLLLRKAVVNAVGGQVGLAVPGIERPVVACVQQW